MTNASTEIHYLCLDNKGNSKVSVYLRSLSKTQVYYARFKIDKRELANGQRFITESLKTSDLDEAKSIAQQRYAEIKFAQSANLGLKDLTVSEGIKKFLDIYETKVGAGISGWSKSMMTIHRLHLMSYWTPYVGNRKLNSISFHDLDGYESWRRLTNTERCKKRLGNMRETLARTAYFGDRDRSFRRIVTVAQRGALRGEIVMQSVTMDRYSSPFCDWFLRFSEVVSCAWSGDLSRGPWNKWAMVSRPFMPRKPLYRSQ